MNNTEAPTRIGYAPVAALAMTAGKDLQPWTPAVGPLGRRAKFV